MFQLLIQALIFIFASAFILQFIASQNRKKLVYVSAFVLLVITNYYLVINVINLYDAVIIQISG